LKFILIFGGDLRNLHLYNKCVLNQKHVALAGFDRIDQKYVIEQSLIKKCDLLIGPIPLTTDGKTLYLPYSSSSMMIDAMINKLSTNTRVVAGLGSIQIQNEHLIDITKNEEFYLKNIIPTVEGIIEIMIGKSDRTLHGSKTLILGFGRIGTKLSATLKALGTNITLSTNSLEDEKRSYNLGYNHIQLNKLSTSMLEYDFIINTIPSIYVNEKVIDQIPLSSILIDVASVPGGVDKEYADKTNHQLIVARGIPGKSSPRSVAEYMYEYLSQEIKEFTE